MRLLPQLQVPSRRIRRQRHQTLGPTQRQKLAKRTQHRPNQVPHLQRHQSRLDKKHKKRVVRHQRAGLCLDQRRHLPPLQPHRHLHRVPRPQTQRRRQLHTSFIRTRLLPPRRLHQRRHTRVPSPLQSVWDLLSGKDKPLWQTASPKETRASMTCLSISTYSPILLVTSSLDETLVFFDIHEKKYTGKYTDLSKPSPQKNHSAASDYTATHTPS